MTLIWLFWQILISNCKFLMPRPLKWSLLGAHTMILSKIIHKVTKTDYVWLIFLWIRRYVVLLAQFLIQGWGKTIYQICLQFMKGFVKLEIQFSNKGGLISKGIFSLVTSSFPDLINENNSNWKTSLGFRNIQEVRKVEDSIILHISWGCLLTLDHL